MPKSDGVPCPFCDGGVMHVMTTRRKASEGKTLRYRKCRSCGTTGAFEEAPRPGSALLEAFAERRKATDARMLANQQRAMSAATRGRTKT